MKVILSSVFGLFLFLTACTHTSKKSSPRNPSSASKYTATSFLRLLLEIDRQDKKNYRVIHFPPRSGADVAPQGFEIEFHEYYRRYELDDLRIFHPHGTIPQGMTYEDWKNDFRKSLRSEILGNFSFEERMELLDLCYDRPLRAGDRIRMASVIAAGNICVTQETLLSKDEIFELFKTFPAHPGKVSYDGNLGFHVYKDVGLRKQVIALTAAINFNKLEAHEVIHSAPDQIKKKFQKNSEGISEEEKIEPFDLISTMTTQMIFGSSFEGAFNKIQVSKVAQKALAHFFLMMSERDAHLLSNPTLSVMKDEDTVTVFCANGIFPSKSNQFSNDVTWYNSFGGTQLVEIWQPSIKLSQITTHHKGVANLSCNANNYRFEMRSIPTTPVPPPEPLNYQNQDTINALITISLSSEIDRSAVNSAKLLISTLGGWEIEKDLESVQTKPYFEREFVRSDAYIPVMHAMDINYFNIGTYQSYALKLKRSVKEDQGRTKTLRLTILFPDASVLGQQYVAKPEDLSVLLEKRYGTKKNSLFLMNNSCASEKTLLAWTLVFRKALEIRKKNNPRLDISKVTDFPHVIGSKRSFGTSSTMEIFSHAEFPLHSLELLAEGKGMPEVLAFLKTPASQGFLGKISGFFNSSTPSASPASSFEPEYILDHPTLLEIGGFEINVLSRGIKGKNTY